MQFRLQHSLLLFCTALACVTAGSSCALDPVHDSSVKALGDEDPNWPQGPYHRDGQSCTVCHGGQGPAKSTFLMAGTVYLTAGTKDSRGKPANKAEVRIRDARNPNGYKCVYTNCRGNFYVTNAQFPDGIFFPAKVSISKGMAEKPMNSLIGRENSCGACHKNPAFYDSPGQIYLYNAATEIPSENGDCTPDTPIPQGECD